MHEVKWFVLYHNPAAIKQEKSAPVHKPRSKRNPVRPRGNQAGGVNEAPPGLCPFLYNFPLVFAFCRNLPGGRVLIDAEDGGKRWTPGGLRSRARGRGFSPVGRVNCEGSCRRSLRAGVWRGGKR